MTVTIAPREVLAPTVVTLEGRIESSGAIGAETFTWLVDGEPERVRLLDLQGKRAELEIPAAGSYEVELRGSKGDSRCRDAAEQIVAGVGDAEAKTYRLRFVPAVGQAAPIQEQRLTVTTAGDFPVGDRGLDNGVLLRGSVTADDAPVAAYVRATPVAGGVAVEGFAAADGQFALRVVGGRHEVLVVPVAPTLAPRLQRDVDPAAALEVDVAGGSLVRGSVVDATGAALAGAAVSLHVEGVPSTLGETGADGRFAVRTHSVVGAVAVAVAPSLESGLPELYLESDAVELTAPLEIAFTIANSNIIAPVLRDAMGEVAGSVRALWIAAELPAAGTIAGLPAAGSIRRAAQSGADGRLSPVRLPSAVYSLVTRGSGHTSLQEVNLAAAPSELTLAPPTRVMGRVLGSDGEPAAGAQVTAVPLGLLTATEAIGAEADSDGHFALSLAANASYELIITAPGARLRAPLSAPALGDIVLPRAQRLVGRVSIPGQSGGAAGVAVIVLCGSCEGPQADRPLGEAVTDAQGRFAVSLPSEGPSDAR